MFDREALNRLYRYAYSLALHEQDAYDLLQDALERYLRSTRGGVSAPEAFLRRIIRNRFIDGLRRQAARPEDPVADPATAVSDFGTATLETMVMAKEELEQVWPLLDVVEREILYLWAVEGCTIRELAAELDLPRGTVLSRIHRLRNRLQDGAGAAAASGGGP